MNGPRSRLGEVVEHVPVGIFVFDEEGRYVLHFRACETTIAGMTFSIAIARPDAAS